MPCSRSPDAQHRGCAVICVASCLHCLLQYREVFSSYSDGNSYISIKEMGSLARYLKLNPTDAQLRKLRKEYDVDGDGTINFREFVILMLELESLRGSDDPEFQARRGQAPADRSVLGIPAGP